MIAVAYLNNRHHDPTLGQFLSVDPLVVKTGEPYVYGAGNPTTYSDPTGLCASELWDYCLDGIGTFGGIDDLGTRRLAVATNLPGASAAAVASAIDLLQVGQYDHSYPSVAGDYAVELFNSGINSGQIIPNSDGGYMLAACEEWCRSFWAAPISEPLLGIESTVLDTMVETQLIASASQLLASSVFAPVQPSTRTYVVGGDMKNRVIPYAQAHGYEYWTGPNSRIFDALNKLNGRVADAYSSVSQRWWINKATRSGARVVDIGTAPGTQPSQLYQIELRRLDHYWNTVRSPQ